MVEIAARIVGQQALLAAQVDAALAPYALSNQRSRSLDVQYIISWMLNCVFYTQQVARQLVLRHLCGDGNVPADLTSRGLWEEFSRLCEVLRVRPIAVALEDMERQLVLDTLQHAATTRGDMEYIEELPHLFDSPDGGGEAAANGADGQTPNRHQPNKRRRPSGDAPAATRSATRARIGSARSSARKAATALLGSMAGVEACGFEVDTYNTAMATTAMVTIGAAIAATAITNIRTDEDVIFAFVV